MILPELVEGTIIVIGLRQAQPTMMDSLNIIVYIAIITIPRNISD